MAKLTFSQIRSKYPSSYLLLFNYEEVNLPNGQVEIISAEDAQSFETGDAMLDAFKAQRRSGKKIMFCTPEYRDRLIIERRPSMRVLG